MLAGGRALVRAARGSVLTRAGYDVVADTAHAAAAAEAAARYGARAVLLDSEVPAGLVAAVRRIAERAPAARVLVVAPELDHGRLLAAVRAGAQGFLPETVGSLGLVHAVEAALEGEVVLPRAGIGILVEELRRGTKRHTSVDGVVVRLTRREADVITRRRAGMTPKEIAAELEVSDVTVRRHLSSVARKARQARSPVALESTS